MACSSSVFASNAPRDTLTHCLLIHTCTDDHLRGSRSFSIPNMRAVTGLINNEAHGAYTRWISPQVLYHLLRAAEHRHCEINRGICLPAAKPRWPSSH